MPVLTPEEEQSFDQRLHHAEMALRNLRADMAAGRGTIPQTSGQLSRVAERPELGGGQAALGTGDSHPRPAGNVASVGE